MRKVRFGEITDSCLGKMLDAEKNKGEYQPYLANINVRWGGFDLSDLSMMRFQENEQERFGIKENDLIICEGGEPGRCALWDNAIPNMKIQKALHRVRAHEGTDIRYLYYWMLLAGKKGLLQNYFTGSTIKHLPGDKLKEIELEIPSYEEQQSISDVLICLDKKIKVNERINDNLAEMAHTTYMHLFFGRKANGKIGDILIENTKSPIQVGSAKEATGNYPFFTSGDAVLEWPEPLINGRNIYLNTGGNAGLKFYVGEAAYSTDTWCITARDELSDYLYLLLESIKPELSQKFFQGTGLKHLQKPMLKDRAIYIPSNSELCSFNKSIMPWFTMISDNIRESQQLTALRDWLLPMLMNGQATICD